MEGRVRVTVQCIVTVGAERRGEEGGPKEKRGLCRRASSAFTILHGNVTNVT